MIMPFWMTNLPTIKCPNCPDHVFVIFWKYLNRVIYWKIWDKSDQRKAILLGVDTEWLLQLPQHNHSHCGVWNTWSRFSRPLSRIHLQSQSSAFLWKNCSFTTLYSFHFVSCKNRIVRIFVTESLEMLTQNRQKCWHRIVRNVDTESSEMLTQTR